MASKLFVSILLLHTGLDLYIGQVRGQCVVLSGEGFFTYYVMVVMSLVLDGVGDGGVRAPHSPPSSQVFPP